MADDTDGLLTLCRTSNGNLAAAEAVVSQVRLSRNRYALRAVEMGVVAQAAAAMNVSEQVLQRMATAARLTPDE
jgi:predicted DNA-binding protein (UPF0251 family)